MSWKISNGFIFKKISTLEKAFEYLKKYSLEFEMNADEHWKRLAVPGAIVAYDRDCIENEKFSKNYMSYEIA